MSNEFVSFDDRRMPRRVARGVRPACLGLSDGSALKHSEAFSFQITTEDQIETHRYWNVSVDNGGAESECGRS